MDIGGTEEERWGSERWGWEGSLWGSVWREPELVGFTSVQPFAGLRATLQETQSQARPAICEEQKGIMLACA